MDLAEGKEYRKKETWSWGVKTATGELVTVRKVTPRLVHLQDGRKFYKQDFLERYGENPTETELRLTRLHGQLSTILNWTFYDIQRLTLTESQEMLAAYKNLCRAKKEFEDLVASKKQKEQESV